MTNIGESTDTSKIQFLQQSSDIATPSAGLWRIYFKSTGLYVIGPSGVALRVFDSGQTLTASQVSDFDTEVSNNTDVAANTAARHDALTVSDGTTIDLTLTGQDLTAEVIEGAIDHDSLLNFVADEHIAHSGITLTAGAGLTGGGTIAANRSFALNINGQTAETTFDGADELIGYDVTAATLKKYTMSHIRRYAVGAYLGNGSTSKGVSLSQSFYPAIIIINVLDPDANPHTQSWSSGVASGTAGVIGRSTGAFTVSAGGDGLGFTNENGVTYYYAAFGTS